MSLGTYDRRAQGGGYGTLALIDQIIRQSQGNAAMLNQQQQQSEDQGGQINPRMISQVMDKIQAGGGSAGTGIPVTGQEINGMNVHWGPNTASGMGADGGSWWSNLADMFGSSGGSGAEGAGYGTLGYIAAAIAGQHMASKDTDRHFEGVQTGDAFDKHFFTEPWYAWLTEKIWGGGDSTVTQGEKMDAAIENDDWGLALKRLPASADYWADPIRSWLGYDLWKNIGDKTFGDDSDASKVMAFIADPIQGLLRKIEDWF